MTEIVPQLDKLPQIDWIGLNNQWVGFPDLADVLDKNGNFLAFSPLPEGIAGLFGAGLLAGFLFRLAKTPDGQKQIVKLATTYLENTTEILKKLHDVNGSNAFVALFQNRMAVPIYRKLGFMTPKEATLLEAWFDHCMGEMLRVEYVSQAVEALKGAETLVNNMQTKEGNVKGGYETQTGLAAAAKILGAGVIP